MIAALLAACAASRALAAGPGQPALMPEASPFLGILSEDVPSAERTALGIPNAARVVTVMDKSPAAGVVKPGDLVLEMNGQPVEGPLSLLEVSSKVPMGMAVPILLRRAGTDTEVSVTTRPGSILQALDAQSARAVVDGVYVQMTFAPKKAGSSGTGSLTRQEPSGTRQAFLGVSLIDNPAGAEWDESGLPKGALVREVLPHTAAEEAGVQQGDIVTWVKGRPVNSKEELIAAVSTLPSGSELKIVVQRNGIPVTLNVVLGEKPVNPDPER